MKFILTLLTIVVLANINIYATTQSADLKLTPFQDLTCPENVKQIRFLMASTYNTCDAIDHTLTMDRINERKEYIQSDENSQTVGSSPNRLGRACKYSDGNNTNSSGVNCAYISDYDLAVSSHPYNSLGNKCEGIGNRCMIGGELRICPTFYYMGLKDFYIESPYIGNIESIDPARVEEKSCLYSDG